MTRGVFHRKYYSYLVHNEKEKNFPFGRKSRRQRPQRLDNYEKKEIKEKRLYCRVIHSLFYGGNVHIGNKIDRRSDIKLNDTVFNESAALLPIESGS